ncbi:unnamed protein product [Ectocarpus sp. 12 AP-2014]
MTTCSLPPGCSVRLLRRFGAVAVLYLGGRPYLERGPGSPVADSAGGDRGRRRYRRRHRRHGPSGHQAQDSGDGDPHRPLFRRRWFGPHQVPVGTGRQKPSRR